MDISKILNHFEKQLNWSLKDGKFIEVPEELHGVDMKPLWNELRAAGYEVEFGPDFTMRLNKTEEVPECPWESLDKEEVI